MVYKILITGAAGFIGFHLAKELLKMGHEVIGLDNINDYYSPQLKFARLKESGISEDAVKWFETTSSTKYANYSFVRMGLENKPELMALCEDNNFDIVVNLAAQAGVRYSIKNPDAYAQSNLVGFLNVLEACRHNKVKHLVYASSSSVYGLNETMPFSVQHNVDHPVSLYAATKKANELMAHAYSHLYNIPTSGLRFFTVYGPWGRPDMAYHLFADAISAGRTIKVFNYGKMQRDFTYIDDIVSGIISVIKQPATGDINWSGKSPDPSRSKASYQIYNIGNNKPIELMSFIKAIEKNMGKVAELEMLGMQDGDVPATWADIGELVINFDYNPSTPIDIGLKNFVTWYKGYYNITN